MNLDSLKQVVESTEKRLDPERLDELRARVRSAKQVRRTERDREVMRSPILRGTIADPAPTAVERMMGTDDLVSVSYLARAQIAARAVCRIVFLSHSGNEVGYGTGFLVSPRVLMTNHHVLSGPEAAASAVAEFGYEHDVNGQLLPTTRFPLAPRAFFMNDKKLDFALCAVSQTPRSGNVALRDYGFLRMFGGEGRVALGDFVTIIQHPSGRPKQVALRENELLALTDDFMHYQSDTAPGSSGSPVFNDSWQIVGLHHSGVPRTDSQGRWLLRNGDVAGPDDDDGDIDWIANEGVRSSRIVEFVRNSRDERSHAAEFIDAADGALEPPPPVASPITPDAPRPAPDPVLDHPAPARSTSDATDPLAPRVEPVAGGARVTLPISFTVSLDSVGGAIASSLGARPETPQDVHRRLFVAPEGYKQPKIDDDYSSREGYQEDFLGVDLPMPRPRWTSRVVKMEDGEHVIPYEHFSLVMDKSRRMALLTAANVDGRRSARRPEPDKKYTRKALNGFTYDASERWALDPRIPAADQIPDLFYTKDRRAFDKGHLVRRDVVCWGSSYEQVQRANGDSFHVTNCSPQVADFNRAPGIWGGLENAIMDHAEKLRLCVFCGPLFRRNDRWFDGVDKDGELRIKIPRTYWKVVACVEEGELSAYAFLLSQDLGKVQFRPEELTFEDEWEEFAVSIEDLDRWTPGVKFPAVLKRADRIETAWGSGRMESLALGGLERLRLPELDEDAEVPE